MKRSSIVGPLLLIGIGALFLARNIYPDLPLLDYLAKYWPFLLVMWGGLRLAEILFWAATSRQLPARGVSGGEWILVVFLIVFGSGLHAARGFYNWIPRDRIRIGGLEVFGESFDYPIAGQTAASKTPRVVIESFRGSARIVGADAAEVKVTGRRLIRGFDRGSADKGNQDAKFEIAGDANQVIVRTNQERISRNQQVSDDLEITVPKGAMIEAHGRNGDFDLNGIGGNVEITSDNAGVRLENIGGEVRLDLRRSDVVRAMNIKGPFDLKGRGSDVDLQNVEGQVTVNGTYTGTLQFQSLAKPLRFTGPQTELNIERLPGQVRMAIGNLTASNLVGPVRLSSRSKDVQISDVTNSLEITLDRGDIELRPGSGPLPKMDVHTRSGDVQLVLPAGAKFDLTASSGRGEVTNDFGAPLRLESNGHGGTIRGSNGGPAVNLQTDRGEMLVRKTSADDVAPRPPAAPVPPVPPSPKQIKPIEQ